jgi:SAM-dependent methyltransferase
VAIESETARFYDESYKRGNYFHYHAWIYSLYISSLTRFCRLKKGASILDVGCGQGFFSYLLSQNGMKVRGIDISETGIGVAERLYGESGVTFVVADARTTVFPEAFDCVFVRSCSLYNTSDFPWHSETTERLLQHLKPGGTFVFLYNSNFSARTSPTWHYHSLEDVRRHFSQYPDARVFFLNRLVTCFLGRLSFSRIVTRVTMVLSRLTRAGGDLVCILKKPAPVCPADYPRESS